jgi:hypothetical protein
MKTIFPTNDVISGAGPASVPAWYGCNRFYAISEINVFPDFLFQFAVRKLNPTYKLPAPVMAPKWQNTLT